MKDKRPPEQLSNRELWRRVVRRHNKIIRDAEQFIRDVEWWNNNRTECEPMDCEPERVLRAETIKSRDQFIANSPEPL